MEEAALRRQLKALEADEIQLHRDAVRLSNMDNLKPRIEKMQSRRREIKKALQMYELIKPEWEKKPKTTTRKIDSGFDPMTAKPWTEWHDLDTGKRYVKTDDQTYVLKDGQRGRDLTLAIAPDPRFQDMSPYELPMEALDVKTYQLGDKTYKSNSITLDGKSLMLNNTLTTDSTDGQFVFSTPEKAYGIPYSAFGKMEFLDGKPKYEKPEAWLERRVKEIVNW